MYGQCYKYYSLKQQESELCLWFHLCLCLLVVQNQLLLGHVVTSVHYYYSSKFWQVHWQWRLNVVSHHLQHQEAQCICCSACCCWVVIDFTWSCASKSQLMLGKWSSSGTWLMLQDVPETSLLLFQHHHSCSHDSQQAPVVQLMCAFYTCRRCLLHCHTCLLLQSSSMPCWAYVFSMISRCNQASDYIPLCTFSMHVLFVTLSWMTASNMPLLHSELRRCR